MDYKNRYVKRSLSINEHSHKYLLKHFRGISVDGLKEPLKGELSKAIYII